MKIKSKNSPLPDRFGERGRHPVTDLQAFALPSSFWAVEAPLNNEALRYSPFFFWLIEALRPGRVVTIGAGSTSATICSSFCQAVARLSLASRCFWFSGEGAAGDASSNPELEGFRELHDDSYAAFSTIVDAGPENPGSFLQEGSVDVLGIDGLSWKGDPRVLVEQMRPYLSERAAVFVLGTNSPDDPGDPGVSSAYTALAGTYPSFAFDHGAGLGVLDLGAGKSPLFESLLEAAARKQDHAAVCGMFSRLGQGCLDSCQLQEARKRVSWLYRVRNKLRSEVEQKEALVNEMTAEVREARSWLSSMSGLLLKFDESED